MEIYPAIDIIAGQCVRLKQGDYERTTFYANSPAKAARAFEVDGAEWVHVIDLDGSKTGSPVNVSAISDICSDVDLSVQVGGGIRSLDDAQKLKDVGVDRVVLGTVAIENPNIVSMIATVIPVALALDFRDGILATHGWTKHVQLTLPQVLEAHEHSPLSGVIVTDIAKDGTLTSPNWNLMQECLDHIQFPVIASGGIAELRHIRQLSEMRSSDQKRKLEGCLIGKALYEHRFSVTDARHSVQE